MAAILYIRTKRFGIENRHVTLYAEAYYHRFDQAYGWEEDAVSSILRLARWRQ